MTFMLNDVHVKTQSHMQVQCVDRTFQMQRLNQDWLTLIMNPVQASDSHMSLTFSLVFGG